MPWTILARLARNGRIKFCSFVVSVALCAPLAATSILLPASTAQACGITRRIHNKTDRDIYVEIWKGGARRWVSTEPIKPGSSLSLEYVQLGDTLILTSPKPLREWATNPFGVVLDIHRCDVIRIAGESKLGVFDVKVSRPSNAEISITGAQ